jgi:cytochrome P450
LRLTGAPWPIYAFRHPDQVGEILRHPSVGITKHPGIMPRVGHVMGHGGYILEGGDAWWARRAEVQPGFRAERLGRYSRQVPVLVERLFELWDGPATQGQAVDIAPALRALITHVNAQLFFSKDWAGSAGLMSDALTRIEHQTHAINLDFVRALPLAVPSPRNLRFRRHARALRQTMRTLVAERRAAGASAAAMDDLLTVLLQGKHADTGRPWTDDDVVDEIFSVYFGASVVSTTLAWCLHRVVSHPAVQERVITEVREVLQGRVPTLEDLRRLPYTEQVLLETTRLFPPSWGYPRRAVQGMTVGGQAIEPGSLVMPMVYFTHRHPDFWADPECFDPDRFSAGRSQGQHRFAHFPYGLGPRKCLGANLAPLVMLPILARIFQRYRFRFTPRFAGDPRPEFGFEIHPRDGIEMQIERLPAVCPVTVKASPEMAAADLPAQTCPHAAA